ncbi:MAG: WYL domain-containing protein [Paludibacteraceae bacterium]
MAAQNKLFQRLIWLVDTIYSAGHITREEIDRRWAHSPYNDTNATEYGERNFHRHRDTIYELFGIEITCNRTTKEYALASLGDFNQGGVRAWLIDTFAINNMVNLAGDMQNRILFERIPEGSRYLSNIVSAMKEGRRLKVTYQRFDCAESHSFLLSPYCLKVFNRRWYLVGKPENHPEETIPRVYALDRVKELTIADSSFRMPKDFVAAAFFNGYFGIDRSIVTPEHIQIKVSAPAANYIRTLPIHDSQCESERNELFSVFDYDVAPTYDFIQELRKHGAHLEILEPKHLREDFKRESILLTRIYGDK